MFRFAPLFLACLAAPAFAARQLQDMTVVELAVATPSLSTLVVAVTAADLGTALSAADGTFTVFAPDDDAFGMLPDGLLATLQTPGFNAHLKEILLYHVYADAAVTSTALAATQDITMMNGEMLTVIKTGTAVTVTTTAGQTATVTMADVEGSNGVVHIIDGVLVPSSIGSSVIDLAAADYSTLLSLITRAELEDTVTTGGPYTLFAPTNTAFEAVDADLLALLTSDAGMMMLSSILTYHVVSGSVTSDMLMNDMMVETVEGAEVTIMIDMATVMVNDATVVKADMLAFNGVTHGIDKILTIPPSMAPAMTQTMAPTMAPTSGSVTFGASISALFAGVFALAL